MISDTDKLLVAQHNHVLTITLSNPPANTWDEDSLSGLQRLVREAETAGVYALVLTGAGAKFFSAGAELRLFADGDKAMATSMASGFGEAFECLAAFPGVSIAAINGYAMGGGLECALACDVRIAEEQSVLALPEASVGLLPCGGGTQNLSWLVGEDWAKRMILCGERVDAQKALAIGLVSQVTVAGAAYEAAMALGDAVARQSPQAVAACKRLIATARRNSLPADAYREERAAFVRLFDHPDQQEGTRAFLEKRPPKWQGA